MDRSYAAAYRELYERHWWWRAREALVRREIERLRPAGGWGRILDVGCGDGLFFDYLSTQGQVEGVEPDAELLSGRPRPGPIHVAPFDTTFRPGHRFGLILMLDVLEHLEDPVDALRHVASLLEPNGVWVGTVPAFRALWTAHDDANHHVTRYRRQGLRTEVEAAGLDLVEARYFFHWVFPAKLLVRALEAVRSPSDSNPRIPGGAVSGLLEGVSRLEHRVARPLRLPFGSSLLAVARRTTPAAAD